jgi:hypothetical protein
MLQNHPRLTHLLAVMLKGRVNVASSFFMVVMSNVRSRQLLVEICTRGWAGAAGA